MLRLLNPNVAPVGGYRFVDPDSGFVYTKEYRTFEDLASHVKTYREQNKFLPLDDFRRVWENWICQEFGMERSCCPVEADIARNFEQYLSGAKAFVRRIVSKETLVTQKVAERRASTCVDCDKNQANMGHRMAQLYSDKVMGHMTKGKSTSLDTKLFTCAVCTCILRPKVHFPSKEVAESLSDTDIGRLNREPKSLSTGKHLHCWQLDAVEEVKGK